MKRLHGSTPLGFLAGITLLAGCGGRSAEFGLPDFDPDAIGAEAVAALDSDGDGSLTEIELEQAPGLKAALSNLDTDSDNQVTAAEIAERIRTWQTMQIRLMSISCEVYLDGQPLEGATVTFEPEALLGDTIKAAVGETGIGGLARPKVPKQDRPSPDSPPGVQPGFYKVKISKIQNGQELIPARYNEATTLGQQVARDDRAIANKQVVFRLTSK